MLPAELAPYPTQYDASLLAIAVFASTSLKPVYANASFLRFYKAHSLIHGQELIKHPELQQAAQQCWQQRQMVAGTLSGSRMRYELSPLSIPGAVDYLQCLLLHPMQQVAASEEALRQSTDPALAGLDLAYARIIDHFPHSVWLATSRGEVFWTNRVSNQYAYGQDEAHDAGNTRYISKIHPEDLAAASISLVQAVNGNPPLRPSRYRLRDQHGVYHWHEFSVAPVHDGNHQLLYWVGSSINIEHIIADEQQKLARLERLQTDLAQLQHELEQHIQHQANEQKSALIGHLSGGIAHDLNNLLQIVAANTELALLELPSPLVESKLNLISSCVTRAGRMASHLASFSGREQQNACVLDTSLVLHECSQLMKRAVGAEVDFQAVISKDLHPVVADRSQLENALINLAINARDAVHGRGKVWFEAFNVDGMDGSGQRTHHVRMTLSDDGMGMDKELQSHVFEPFFTTKPEGKGTGLGLPMVSRFIQNANGQVSLHSAPGEGTSISLILPRSEKTAEASQTLKSTKTTLDVRILLIEDDEQVRQSIHQLLSKLGCEVIPSFNTDHAMALLAGGVSPQVIISDIRMPGHSSARELIAWVEESPGIVLIFATGYGPDAAAAEGLLDSRYPILFKPFALEELTQLLQRTPGGTSSAG